MSRAYSGSLANALTGYSWPIGQRCSNPSRGSSTVRRSALNGFGSGPSYYYNTKKWGRRTRATCSSRSSAS